MPETVPVKTGTVPPYAQLIQMATAHCWAGVAIPRPDGRNEPSQYCRQPRVRGSSVFARIVPTVFSEQEGDYAEGKGRSSN
jgi:hypothetical protein